jgi:hypothetical protein
VAKDQAKIYTIEKQFYNSLQIGENSRIKIIYNKNEQFGHQLEKNHFIKRTFCQVRGESRRKEIFGPERKAGVGPEKIDRTLL